MLNLLKFKKNGGSEMYFEYSVAIAPLLKKVGGEVIYSGLARQYYQNAPGGVEWDMVAIVRYPSIQAFSSMTNSTEYQKIFHLRENSLETAVLCRTEKLTAELFQRGRGAATSTPKSRL